jgi:hypothetical protein
VELIELHLELLPSVHHDAGEEGPAVRHEQAIEGPTDRIIPEV